MEEMEHPSIGTSSFPEAFVGDSVCELLVEVDGVIFEDVVLVIGDVMGPIKEDIVVSPKVEIVGLNIVVIFETAVVVVVVVEKEVSVIWYCARNSVFWTSLKKQLT